MKNENRISTRDITRDYGFGHGDVMGVVRDLLDKGLIRAVPLARYQNPQNKRNFDMFFLDDIDIDWLLTKLANRDQKWPVTTITKELRDYVMTQHKAKCVSCGSSTDIFVQKIDEAGRICSRNLHVICGCCSDESKNI